jgi:hypothetical protein
MKKALTVMALLAGAASVYAQGEVSMLDYGGSFTIQVFSSQGFANSPTPVTYGGATGFELMGQSGNDSLNNPGSTSYNPGTALGTGYSVELLAASGSGDSVASLSETGTVITTWYSAAGGEPTAGLNGYWNSGANATVANAAPGTAITVALAAWNNEGGTVSSLAQAISLSDAWGISAPATIASVGGGINPPTSLPTSITSFSLIAATTVPEPSTIALGVIGASTFLMRLRRKQ